jgi:hypothetical protein
MSELTNFVNDQDPELLSEDTSIIDHLIKIFPNKGPERDDRHVVSADGFARIRCRWSSESRMMLHLPELG